MLAFERRQAHAVLEAFAPPSNPGLSPDPGEVDFAGGLAHVLRWSTRKGALGFRFALWLVAFAPLWMGGKLRTAAGLGIDKRGELLRALAEHRWFLVREMMMLMKMVASFAMFGTASVRDRSHYDRGATRPWEDEDAVDSGVRHRRLRVVAAGAGEDGATGVA